MRKLFKLSNYYSIFLLFVFQIKYKLLIKKRVSFGKHLKIYNYPLINIKKGCSLQIGDNVTINSKNKEYHINMFARTKIFCDRKGARISIGNNTRIHGSCIHAYKSITIGNNCLIAANCQIFDGNGHDLSFDNPAERINSVGNSKPITIEDNVWIATNCIILPGSYISEGCVISAGSVVNGFFPSRKLIKGNPAIIFEK